MVVAVLVFLFFFEVLAEVPELFGEFLDDGLFGRVALEGYSGQSQFWGLPMHHNSYYNIKKVYQESVFFRLI